MLTCSIVALLLAAPQSPEPPVGFARWWHYRQARVFSEPIAPIAPSARPDSDAVRVGDFYVGTGATTDEEAAVAPTPAQLRAIVRPALVRALAEDRDARVRAASLLALAELHRAVAELHRAVAELPAPGASDWLRADDSILRASAALALGIGGESGALTALIALLHDTEAGRELVGRSPVGLTTRVFAAYGLAALAQRRADERLAAFDALVVQLRDASPARAALRIAVVHAISGIAASAAASSPDGRLAERSVREFTRIWGRSDGSAAEQLVQAQVPAGIAAVLSATESGAGLSAWAAEQFVSELDADRGAMLRRAAVLGLAELGPDATDAAVDALWNHFRNGRDLTSKGLVLLALGEFGGDRARQRLTQVLRRGSKVNDRPWAVLGLGLSMRRRGEADAELTGLMLDALRTSRHADAVGASALALGLARAKTAAADLRALLRDDERALCASFAAVALALLGDLDSAEPMRSMLDEPDQRLGSHDRQRIAVSVGVLRDRASGPVLVELLAENGDIGYVRALGALADHTTLGPLVELLADETRAAPIRASAARTLSRLASGASVWHAPFSVGLDFSASRDSISDWAAFVLDLR